MTLVARPPAPWAPKPAFKLQDGDMALCFQGLPEMDCMLFKKVTKFSLFGIFCAFLGLMGCSPEDSSYDGGIDDIPRYSLDTGLRYSLEQAPLAASEARCREEVCDKALFQSVGLVVFVTSGDPEWGSYEAGQCTGFLFGAKNIVALNSHCITDKVKENKERCGDFLGIKFPAVAGRSEEVRMCKELLYVSPLRGTDIQADYAYFRIDLVERNPLSRATTGIPNDEAVRLLKIDPLNGTIGGSYGISECKTTMGSVLYPEYTSPWSIAALALDPNPTGTRAGAEPSACHNVRGNSGSPSINSKGEVVGINFGQISGRRFEILGNRGLLRFVGLDFVDFKFPEVVPSHVVMTNIACMRDSRGGPPINSACAVATSATPPEMGARSLVEQGFRQQLTPDKLDEFRREWLQKVSPDLRFQIQEITTGHYELIPTCARYQNGQTPVGSAPLDQGSGIFGTRFGQWMFSRNTLEFAFPSSFPTRGRIIQVFEVDNRFVESRRYFRFEFDQPTTMNWTVDQGRETVEVSLSPMGRILRAHQTYRIPKCSSSN